VPNENQKPERATSREVARREILKLLGAVVFLGITTYVLGYRLRNPPRAREPSRLVDVHTMTTLNRQVCGEPTEDRPPVVVTMLYGMDKKEWIEDAAQRFAEECPNIQIKLTAMGSVDAAKAILERNIDPTVWSPSDDLILRYLEHRWKQQSSDVLFDFESRVTLVHSPLVVLVLEDRVPVLNAILSKTKDKGNWMTVPCALVPPDPALEGVAIEDMVPGRWINWYESFFPKANGPPKQGDAPDPKDPKTKDYAPDFPTPEEIQSWGRVKFPHASPTRSAAGMESIYLMAFDYVLPPPQRLEVEAALGNPDGGVFERPPPEGGILEHEHLRDAFEKAFEAQKDALKRWLARCEAGLEEPLPSTQLLTDRMFEVGGARYDGVLTYEHVALPYLEKVDSHEHAVANMRLVYPTPTIVNQHPIVKIWPGDATRKEAQDAADRWISFLKSKKIQERAIEYGFRPTSVDVSIRTYDKRNLFLDLRRYGVSVEFVLEEPPRASGHLVEQLIGLWEDATGRH
jgi:hypothetical protein